MDSHSQILSFHVFGNMNMSYEKIITLRDTQCECKSAAAGQLLRIGLFSVNNLC